MVPEVDKFADTKNTLLTVNDHAVVRRGGRLHRGCFMPISVRQVMRMSSR